MQHTSIRHLAFDFGNVLIDLDNARAEAKMKEMLHPDGSMQKIYKAIDQYQAGKISTDIFINTLIAQCTYKVQALDIIEMWNLVLVGLPLHRIEMLKQLRQHYHVYLLSNTNDIHIRWVHRYLYHEYHLEHFEETCFDKVYYSHLMKLAKPDPAYFLHVIRDADIRPEETLFIDDVKENIDAAAALGFQTKHWTPGDEILDWMKETNFIPSSST